jgi:hypothetical protein
MDGPVLRENHKRRSEVGSGLILTTRRHLRTLERVRTILGQFSRNRRADLEAMGHTLPTDTD